MTTNPIFAATTSASHISSLDREIDKNQNILENLGNSTDRVLQKADARISDSLQSERIEQKQAEIKELVDQAQETLEDAKNKKEIQVVLQETKNIIALKV
jgi:methionyl-tRNA synthetase